MTGESLVYALTQKMHRRYISLWGCTQMVGSPGSILRSLDRGTTWSETKLPFKLPGNQRGRGVGERLVVNPANSNIIYFAAPSGQGLWKSTDQGVTFSQVASFTAVGNYAEDPSDTSGYNSVAGAYDAGNGNVYRYATSGTWKNITPAWQAASSLTFGYGGLALDAQNPGTLMVASDNLWYPDVQIFRSNDSVSYVYLSHEFRLIT